MKRPALTKDQYRDHFNRWLLIMDKLPVSFAEKVCRRYPEIRIDLVKKVASGKHYDFAILTAIEETVKDEEIRFFKRQKVRVKL